MILVAKISSIGSVFMTSVRKGLVKLLPENTKAEYRSVRAKLKRAYRSVRTSKSITRVLGPQYRRSRKHVEIDITYVCNLKCNACNRSCSQAPSREHVDLVQIEKFIAESIAANSKWHRMRLLGGEPSLHPELFEILDKLMSYKKNHSPNTLITITTNGFGKRVNSILHRLPQERECTQKTKARRTAQC